MSKARELRLAQLRLFVEHFEQIPRERRATDVIGWVALKLSCSRRQAEKWLQQAGVRIEP